MIFREFADIDRIFPSPLRNHRTPMRSSPPQGHRHPFGGIQLEDISAPRCFDIEARLPEGAPERSSMTTSMATACRAGGTHQWGRLLKKDIRTVPRRHGGRSARRYGNGEDPARLTA